MSWIDMDIIAIDDKLSERDERQLIEFARRKAKPRFYADENFPGLATAILRGYKADVLTVQDTRRKGHPDENHAAEALRLGRILITCDRDYLDERRFPLVQCPALVVFDIGRVTAREIWDTFKCLGAIFSVPQFFDKWTKIYAKRDGWTDYGRNLDGTTARVRYRYQGGRMQEWVDEGFEIP
jgi:predicted nuclease of predicted toxin-antitoxin system